MPGPLPASRPVITDAEVWNGRPSFGTVIRKLIDWERYTFARDVIYAPAAPVSAANTVAPWTKPAVSNASTHAELGSFPTSEPLSRALSLAVRVWAVLSGGSATARLTFTPSSGVPSSHVIDSTALGGTTGWASFSVPAIQGAVLSVTLDYTAGTAGSVTIESLCAWWVPSVPGLTPVAGAFAGISAGYCAEGRPYSTAALKWLQQNAAKVALGRPRILAAAAYGVAGDTLRWKVPVSRGRSTITLYLGAAVSGSGATVAATYNGASALGSTSLPSTGGAITVTTLSLSIPSGPSTDEEAELAVTVTPGGASVTIDQATMQEDEIASLPGADIIAGPGTPIPWQFPSLNSSGITAASPIKASLLADLVRGMACVIGRCPRVLASQSWRPIPADQNPGYLARYQEHSIRLPAHGSVLVPGSWSAAIGVVGRGTYLGLYAGLFADRDTVNTSAFFSAGAPVGVPVWVQGQPLAPGDERLVSVSNTTENVRVQVNPTNLGGTTMQYLSAPAGTTIEFRRDAP